MGTYVAAYEKQRRAETRQVRLPAGLFNLLSKRAKRNHRSATQELAAIVEVALRESGHLPQEGGADSNPRANGTQ